MKLLFMLLSLISASTFKDGISYECKKEENINNCVVYASSNFEVSAIDYEIKGDVLEFVPKDPWLGDYQDNKILLYTDTFQSGKFEIGNIKYKGNLKEKRLSFGNQDFEEVLIYENNNKTNYILVIIIGLCLMIISCLFIKRRRKNERKV